MSEAVAGPRSARAWRLAGAICVGLLIGAALLLAGLRIALATLPGHAERIQAWIEQQTRLRIEYRHLDARLRWYGPEIVLQGVRVLDRDGTQAILATREGSVALDVWNFFRTGQLVAGRIRFAGPAVTLVRLPDGRIRLLGQRERPLDEPPFDLDRLPAGRVVIEDATVTYRDLKTGRGPWQLRHLRLTLRRDRDFVATEGAADLPGPVGTRLRFSGRLRGSLMHAGALTARVEARVDDLRLAGVSELAPDALGMMRGGHGPVSATVTVAAGHLVQARLDLDLAGVTLEPPERLVPSVPTLRLSAPHREPGDTALHLPVIDATLIDAPAATPPRKVRLPKLTGAVRLRRDGDTWTFGASDLDLGDGQGRGTPAAQLSGSLRGNLITTYALRLDARDVRLPSLWPLALSFAPHGFDRWAGLQPSGSIRTLHLEMQRDRAGAEPRFTVAAEVAGLGVQPSGRMPGLTGLTASLSGTNERGRIAVRSGPASFSLPRMFAAPIALRRLSADADWRRAGDAWVFDVRDAALEHERGRARGRAELTVPAGDASPMLDASVQVDHADVAMVRDVLPVGRMRPRTLAWFEGAFVKGEVVAGSLVLRGPLRSFPFRDGEGDFTATADLRGVTLDYFPGFAPLVDGEGTAVFHDAGVVATLRAGQVGGLRLAQAEYSVADFKSPLMKVEATASGDLGRGLAFLQASPLGPQLGSQFMGLGARGPADYAVSLALPTTPERQAERDYRVLARLQDVTVTLPALRAPAEHVTGDFEIHNLEARSQSLRGTMLGGPFQVTVAPAAPSGDVTAAIALEGRGRAAGDALPAFIGLPAGIRMSGAFDWTLGGRFEQRRSLGRWVTHFDVSSSLAGLGIEAPQPFAKAAADSRPTRVGLDFPAPGQDDVTIETGTARARLRFAAGPGGKWDLERGAARFDGQPVAWPARPGLVIEGDWPQFDLAEWLALRPGGAAGTGAGDWLGPVDVHLDRATILGFEFRDVTARLRSAGAAWQVGVTGPMATGQVTIPEDLARGQPIVLEMQRLDLEPVPGQPGTVPPATDPRSVPAITLRADDLVWQSRRFGRVQAIVARDPQGLRLTTLHAQSPGFTLDGTGSWLVEPDGTRTALELVFASQDFGAACKALGYRDAIEAQQARFTASLNWSGGPSADALGRLTGTLDVDLGQGQLLNVKPGAGRILGLLSVAELPRRLSLDFRDVTDKGLAFNRITGHFELRDGSAYTQNLLVKGPAVDIGVVGRTGLRDEDYDQTLVVSGNPGGPLAVAGALAAGPVIGAGVLVLSELFKGQLQGLTRAYYHVSGPWSNPVVERIAAPPTDGAEHGDGEAHGAGK